MRKKLKPDLNLEEIQRVLIEKVVELYNSGLSMRKIGIQLSLSQMKVRKILITAGAYTSQRCVEIQDYYRNGYGVEEIAEIFHMTKSSVYSYLSYETVIYNLDEKSVNADRQARYRERKKQSTIINKPVIEKTVIEKRTKGYMYIVMNQKLRKYLPKGFCAEEHDPLERTFGYTRQERDPDENIWVADVIVSGRGKEKKTVMALENASCGFRLVMDIPKVSEVLGRKLQVPEMVQEIDDEYSIVEYRELMKERIVESIREEFLTFGIPQANVEDYIYNNSYEFVFVKAKPSFPSQNVSEFAESLQERLKIEKSEKNDKVFEDIFSMGFNRTNRKFGYCREYRDVEMATYHMLKLTREQTFDILWERWEKIVGENREKD